MALVAASDLGIGRSEENVLIKDVDRGLDMMCTVAVTENSVWFDMASKIPGRTRARFYDEPDGTFLVLYFARDRIVSNQKSFILANRNAVEKKEIISVAEQIKNRKQLSLTSEMMELPSVIVSQSYLQGNELFISFRFHSSVLDQVNRFLVSHTRENSGTRTAYLGPSPGFMKTIYEISNHTPLTVVRFTLHLPGVPVGKSEIRDVRDSITEADVRRVKENGVKIVIYGGGELPWSETISERDGIHQAFSADPFMFKMGDDAYKARIPIIALFGRRLDAMLQITILVPSAEASEFLTLFFEASKSIAEEQAALDLFQPFSEDMWDWL